jgi:heme/copper-type cytochrome/quinol oxidase subunit 1
MKVKPTHLFLILTLLAVGLGLLTHAQTLDINIHDTYFIIGYLQIAILIGLLSGLTTVCYFIMTKIGRPISNRTGYWHFGLITIGLLFTLTFFKIYQFIADIVYQPNTVRLHDYVGLVTISIGPLLLFAGLTVFAIGLFKAIKRT